MKRSLKILAVGAFSTLIFMLYGCTCVEFSKAEKPYIPPTPKYVQETQKKRLALILGGGGAKGMAHIGVIEELAKAGIQPDLIIGCSAGAIVGALYAAHPDISSLQQLVATGKQSDVITLTLKDWPYSVYDSEHLANYLRKNIKHHNFSDLKIPLLVTATNLEFGNLTTFGEGDIIPAVMASAAAPGAFAPVKIKEQYFFDCGVADPVPVRVARELGYEVVVAVNIAAQLPDTAPKHAFGVVRRSVEIAYVNQCKFAVEGADVVIDFKFKDIGAFSDAHNEFLYTQGKLEGALAIDKIRAALNKKD